MRGLQPIHVRKVLGCKRLPIEELLAQSEDTCFGPCRGRGYKFNSTHPWSEFGLSQFAKGRGRGGSIRPSASLNQGQGGSSEGTGVRARLIAPGIWGFLKGGQLLNLEDVIND